MFCFCCIGGAHQKILRGGFEDTYFELIGIDKGFDSG